MHEMKTIVAIVAWKGRFISSSPCVNVRRSKIYTSQITSFTYIVTIATPRQIKLALHH
jgi:hypothetical protein